MPCSCLRAAECCPSSVSLAGALCVDLGSSLSSGPRHGAVADGGGPARYLPRSKSWKGATVPWSSDVSTCSDTLTTRCYTTHPTVDSSSASSCPAAEPLHLPKSRSVPPLALADCERTAVTPPDPQLKPWPRQISGLLGGPSLATPAPCFGAGKVRQSRSQAIPNPAQLSPFCSRKSRVRASAGPESPNSQLSRSLTEA